MTVVSNAGAVAHLRRLDLEGEYELHLVSEPGSSGDARDLVLSATVPGQVHTDLMRAGLLDNPDVGFGELEQAWIGHSTWRYRREFEWSFTSAMKTELVADGLDTVAEVALNGVTIARTIDQHIRYRWDVQDHLVEGRNVLEVTFRSAWEAAAERERAFGPLPSPYDEPYPYLRKSACNFGWDWGPHFVTAGIWRPIGIESWDARIENVRPAIRLSEDGNSAELNVVSHIELADDREVGVVVELRSPAGDVVSKGTTRVTSSGDAGVSLTVSSPELWWPVGYGEQPLYELRVLVQDEREISLHSWQGRIGIKSVDVETQRDDVGERWALRVNGRRIKVRGYNWIPDDPFIAEVTRERIEQRLDQAVAGNANLIRVWGGGYFSTEEFMDACDERGLLVWHDFLFACAGYDETGGMTELVRTEAEQAVARLARHASMALWCGGNETVWGSEEWGWEDSLGDERTWGWGFYTNVLPSVVERLDPGRPYIPNSPWSTIEGALASSHESGPTHLWDTWNNRDYVTYRSSSPAFVSEMGWCAPPAFTTLRDALTEGGVRPDNPQVVHHMRAAEGMHKLARGIQPHFPATTSESDWIFHTQLVQADAQRVGAEWLRSRERNAGVIVWQLNDCWPVLSWSAIDSAGIEKPLWHALRSSFAPRLATIQPVTPGNAQHPSGPDGLTLTLVNDTGEVWDATVRLRRVGFDGVERASTTFTVRCEGDDVEAVRLTDEIAIPDVEEQEFIVADVDELRAVWAFVPHRRRRGPIAEWDARVEEGAVVVTAGSVVTELYLFTDLLSEALGTDATDLRAEKQLVTLLPGEKHIFRMSGRNVERLADLDVSALRVGGSILRAANDTDLGAS